MLATYFRADGRHSETDPHTIAFVSLSEQIETLTTPAGKMGASEHPQNHQPCPCEWFRIARTKLLSADPDKNSGIFYLVRLAAQGCDKT